MTTKHQPATPLPWTAMDWPRNPRPEDQAFLIHAANAYPRLVEALHALADSHEALEIERGSQRATHTNNARNLLRELGEE